MHLLGIQSLVAATYVAYFGRPPEADGLDYWTDRIEDGMSYAEVARRFAFERETTARYPDLADGTLNNPASFITQVYENVFERTPTESELAWWTEFLADKPVGDAIQMIVDGATGVDKTTLDNKVEVSLYYTKLSDAENDYRTEEGRAIIDDVDATDRSVREGKQDVEDATIGPDDVRPPVVIEVPVPVPTEPDHIITFTSNGTLDDTATRNFDGVELPFGAGNTPDNYNIALDQTANLELGLKVHYRTGEDVIGTEVEDGVLTYTAAAGNQVNGQGGADGTVMNRSAISVDFSINEGVGELGEDNLTYHLWVDTDPTSEEAYLKLEFLEGPDGRWYGVNEDTGAIVIGDNVDLDHQIANSINFGFGAYAGPIPGVEPGPNSGDIPAGEYMIRLFATNDSDVEVVGVTSILNLVDPVAA